jgi:aspartate-semialdehyde dehydrogenase
MKDKPVFIVGGESLIGRELRDMLQQAPHPVELKLVGVDTNTMTLSEQDGEPIVITPMEEGDLLDSQVTLLAGSRASSERALQLSRKQGSGPVFIDLTYALEQEPSARLRAPMVEPAGFLPQRSDIQVVAHPAAIAIGLFLTRLQRMSAIRRATFHIFEPASERGQSGLDELREQTVSLLSFRPLPKNVYDAQVGFNMLSSFGRGAPLALEEIELRIERHLATLLALWEDVPMPSIRLIQAPVFHGYSISAHVEFHGKPNMAQLTASLASAEVDVRDQDQEPPTNVGIAGQSGIAVGSISGDRNLPSACWFWIVADNFRLLADNAVKVLRSLMELGENA